MKNINILLAIVMANLAAAIVFFFASFMVVSRIGYSFWTNDIAVPVMAIFVWITAFLFFKRAFV